MLKYADAAARRLRRSIVKGQALATLSGRPAVTDSVAPDVEAGSFHYKGTHGSSKVDFD